jgi:hypothetical protein
MRFALCVVVFPMAAMAQGTDPSPVLLRGSRVRVQTEAPGPRIVGTVVRITAESLTVVRGPDTLRWGQRDVLVEVSATAAVRRRTVGRLGSAAGVIASAQLPSGEAWHPLAAVVAGAAIGHSAAMLLWPTQWVPARFPPPGTSPSVPVVLVTGFGPATLQGQRAKLLVRTTNGTVERVVRLQSATSDSLQVTEGSNAEPSSVAVADVARMAVSVGTEPSWSGDIATGLGLGAAAAVPLAFVGTLLVGLPRWVVPAMAGGAAALTAYAMWERTRERFVEARIDVVP